MIQRRSSASLCAAAAALVTASCTLDMGEGDLTENTTDPNASMGLESADQIWEKARGFLTHIKNSDYTQNWNPLFEESSEPRPLLVSSKHPVQVAVYQNDVAKAAMDGWEQSGFPLPLSMPDGSIILKENYAVDEETQALTHMATTIMVKDSSLDEATYPNHWFWIKANPDLTLIEDEGGGYLAGALAGCIGCHNGRTNFGVFPDPDDPAIGGQEDAHVQHDYVILAYCKDPSTDACSID